MYNKCKSRVNLEGRDGGEKGGEQEKERREK